MRALDGKADTGHSAIRLLGLKLIEDIRKVYGADADRHAFLLGPGLEQIDINALEFTFFVDIAKRLVASVGHKVEHTLARPAVMVSPAHFIAVI